MEFPNVEAFLLAFILVWPVQLSEKIPSPISRITFWNIGQGDFITLVSPGGCWAFDAGGSFPIPMNTVVELKDQCPHRRIKLFVSHFDKDHIRNYRKLFTTLIVTDAYFSHLDPQTRLGSRLLADLRTHDTVIHMIRAGFETKMPAAGLQCVWPPADRPLGRGENDKSLVFRLITSAGVFLMTGDLPGKLEKKLPDLKADYLKVAHHGSRTSSTEKWLARLGAKSCVVSVGAVNTYGHPNPETLKRLSKWNCAILRTDRLGDISFEL